MNGGNISDIQSGGFGKENGKSKRKKLKMDMARENELLNENYLLRKQIEGLTDQLYESHQIMWTRKWALIEVMRHADSVLRTVEAHKIAGHKYDGFVHGQSFVLSYLYDYLRRCAEKDPDMAEIIKEFVESYEKYKKYCEQARRAEQANQKPKLRKIKNDITA